MPWNAEKIIKCSYSSIKQYASFRKVNSTVRQIMRSEYNWMDNWVRIKISGLVKVELRYVVAGRILRDEQGEWILDLNQWLRKCSIFDMELRDILDGLLLLQGKQRDRMLMQTYGLKVIEAIQKFNSRSSSSELIRHIRQLLKNVENWILKYIPREETN